MYRTSVKPFITKWWRDRLESSHEWYIIIIESPDSSASSETSDVMMKVGEDFHSRAQGDRSNTLEQVKSGAWHTTFQPYIEKALSARSQQYDDEITSIVDAEFVLNKVFCLHDSFAVLAESLGLWKEALLQYNECLKTIEQNQKISTNLPIYDSYGFMERSPYEMRQMAKDTKELNYGEVIHYIFLRKVQLLFVLNRPSEVLQSGFQMVLLTLEQYRHSMASKRWAVMACWDIMQRFRDKFGYIESRKSSASSSTPKSAATEGGSINNNSGGGGVSFPTSLSPSMTQPPKLDRTESTIIALHVTNLLCCLHRCFLDVAAITPSLKLSYVWSIRKVEQTSQLSWKRTSPLLKKELPKRPRRPPPVVPGSSASTSSTGTATATADTEPSEERTTPTTTFSEPSVALLLAQEFQHQGQPMGGVGTDVQYKPDPFNDVNLGAIGRDWVTKALSDVACFEKCYLKGLFYSWTHSLPRTHYYFT